MYVLFSKSKRYYYDLKAVNDPNGRRLRDVWDIHTAVYPGAHFATFPPELVRRCLMMGSRPNDYVLDPFLGSGTTAEIARANDRHFSGCEIQEGYLPLIFQRLSKASKPVNKF